MWGYAVLKNRILANEIISLFVNKKIASKYNYNGESPKGFDQYFLADYIWYEARKNSTIHDSYSCTQFGPSSPFPTERPKPMCFVSCLYCCNSTLNNEINAECPWKCRPQNHKDWLNC
jgi:hypothetical protein